MVPRSKVEAGDSIDPNALTPVDPSRHRKRSSGLVQLDIHQRRHRSTPPFVARQSEKTSERREGLGRGHRAPSWGGWLEPGGKVEDSRSPGGLKALLGRSRALSLGQLGFAAFWVVCLTAIRWTCRIGISLIRSMPLHTMMPESPIR